MNINDLTEKLENLENWSTSPAEGTYYFGFDNDSNVRYYYFEEKDVEILIEEVEEGQYEASISFRAAKAAFFLELDTLEVTMFGTPLMVHLMEIIKLQKIVNEELK